MPGEVALLVNKINKTCGTKYKVDQVIDKARGTSSFCVMDDSEEAIDRMVVAGLYYSGSDTWVFQKNQKDENFNDYDGENYTPQQIREKIVDTLLEHLDDEGLAKYYPAIPKQEM